MIDRVESMDEEKPFVEQVDGVIVTVPANRLTFHIEKQEGLLGRPETVIIPVQLPEHKTMEFARAVAEAIRGAGSKLKEAME
jgi:hypothetical protein